MAGVKKLKIKTGQRGGITAQEIQRRGGAIAGPGFQQLIAQLFGPTAEELAEIADPIGQQIAEQAVLGQPVPTPGELERPPEVAQFAGQLVPRLPRFTGLGMAVPQLAERAEEEIRAIAPRTQVPPVTTAEALAQTAGAAAPEIMAILAGAPTKPSVSLARARTGTPRVVPRPGQATSPSGRAATVPLDEFDIASLRSEVSPIADEIHIIEDIRGVDPKTGEFTTRVVSAQEAQANIARDMFQDAIELEARGDFDLATQVMNNIERRTGAISNVNRATRIANTNMTLAPVGSKLEPLTQEMFRDPIALFANADEMGVTGIAFVKPRGLAPAVKAKVPPNIDAAVTSSAYRNGNEISMSSLTKLQEHEIGHVAESRAGAIARDATNPQQALAQEFLNDMQIISKNAKRQWDIMAQAIAEAEGTLAEWPSFGKRSITAEPPGVVQSHMLKPGERFADAYAMMMSKEGQAFIEGAEARALAEKWVGPLTPQRTFRPDQLPEVAKALEQKAARAKRKR